MTSTNSLNKSRLAAMLKNVFRRNIAIYIVVQAISALYAYFLASGNLRAIASLGWRHEITPAISGNMATFLMNWGILWSFIIAVLLFREIYSKRAGAFYFAVPVKRETYFNTNMLFGMITFLSSYVLIAFITITAIRSNAFCPAELIAFETGNFLLKLTVALTCVFASFAIFMLCAVISGKVWHYFVLSFISTAAALSGIMNFANYLSSIWGFWVDPSKAWIVSPAGTALFGFREEGELKLIIASIIQFAVFYAIGFVAFKKRKAEVAEVSLAGKVLPAIMMVGCLLSVCLMILSITGYPVIINVVIAVVACAIVTVILTAIFYRKALTKTTAKYLAAAVGIMLVVVCAVEFFPSARYEKYVPSADEVESVIYDENVEFENKSLGGALIDYLLYASYESYYDRGLVTYTFTGDEAKAKVEELHKKIVDDDTLRSEYANESYYYGGYSVRITYNLKNGKSVTRSYCVGTRDIYGEYIDLMQTEEAILQTPPLDCEKNDILFIGIRDYRALNEEKYEDYEDTYDYDDVYIEDYWEVYKSLDEYDTLFGLILNDKKAEPKEVFSDLMTTSAYYVYYYENSVDYNDVVLTVFICAEDVTPELRERMASMTPEDIIRENNDYRTGYNQLYVAYDIYLNADADANTIAYLQSVGAME